MDIYSNFIDLGPVIYLIKEVDKVISDKDFIYILKVEIDIATDSIIIAGIKTLLNIIFITL